MPALTTLATDVTTLTPFSETHLTVRLVVGVLLTIAALSLAAWRGNRIFQVIRSGQPAVGRTDEAGRARPGRGGRGARAEKLLKWGPSGAAHFFTFWGFLILGLTIVEAFGALFDPDFHVPIIGTWPVVGFLEDLMGLLVLCALVVFSVIRIRKNPHKIGRESRFYGSHTGGAWLILASIATIVITLFLYRGAQINNGTFPFDPPTAAFVSNWVAGLLEPLGATANEWIETVFILASFGAVLGTTILVLYSKHMHIFLAPFNVLFSRRPNGLGPLLPMYSGREQDRLRGPRRRRGVRPRRDHGLHLEGQPRPADLHRVRSVPVAVPGVEHREAALAEAADHGPARQPARAGALPRRGVEPDLPRVARHREGVRARPGRDHGVLPGDPGRARAPARRQPRERQRASSTRTCSGPARCAAPA